MKLVIKNEDYYCCDVERRDVLLKDTNQLIFIAGLTTSARLYMLALETPFDGTIAT